MIGKLKQKYRRWRCDHFDHPYKMVRDVSVDYSNMDPAMVLSGIIDNTKHCNYCGRDFDMPLLHPNCKCSMEVMLDE